MKLELLVALAASVLLAAAAFALGCGDDDDDDAVDRTGDDDDTCLDDHSPELLAVEVIVNGETVQTPVTITQSDQLQLSIEYADVDCNLDGGGAGIHTESESENSITSLPGVVFENMGCSSAEKGAPFVFSVDPLSFCFPDETQSLRIFDSCKDNAGSNMVVLDIWTDTSAP